MEVERGTLQSASLIIGPDEVSETCLLNAIAKQFILLLDSVECTEQARLSSRARACAVQFYHYGRGLMRAESAEMAPPLVLLASAVLVCLARLRCVNGEARLLLASVVS